MIEAEDVVFYHCKNCGKNICDATDDLPIWSCAMCGADADMLEDRQVN